MDWQLASYIAFAALVLFIGYRVVAAGKKANKSGGDRPGGDKV